MDPTPKKEVQYPIANRILLRKGYIKTIGLTAVEKGAGWLGKL